MNNNNFKEYILSKIDEIHDEKKKRVMPSHVLFKELANEVNKDMRDILNKMFEEKEIKVGNTLNEKYIIHNTWQK